MGNDLPLPNPPHGGGGNICVSVIVPAYNASETIARTLEALARQVCPHAFEVIVVDDGSLDNTADVVRAFGAVRYVRQDNAGPASARNHGARLAHGEFLAFTDSDCVPREDWIERLMAGFNPLPHVDRMVGAVAGSYGIANQDSWLARCIYTEILWRHSHLMPDFPEALGSYNFCIKNKVFKQVGGFNTGYCAASGEDNDLSYNIIQAGYGIYFQRQALVDHYHQTNVIAYLKEQFRHGFWRVKMYLDHPRMMRGDGYTFWKDIVEVPLVGMLLAVILAGVCHYVPLIRAGGFVLAPFLLFEIGCALFMTRSFFDGILFGFVLWIRAFARVFGLSTGIVSLLFKMNGKIS